MESLLIAVWFLSVIVAGELTLWEFRQAGKDRSFLLFTIPLVLLGHPLFGLLVGVSGILGLIQWTNRDHLQVAICAFTGPAVIIYMIFRFMPSADMLIWGRRWQP